MATARTPRIWRATLLTITISLFSFPAYAKYSGGTGEPNDPYQIATAEDLMLLGESPEDYDMHFVLTADIDLDPDLPGRRVFDKAIIAPDSDPAKNYFQGTPFSGIFDGNGQTISHLTITGGGYLGLFGQLGPGAKISNLGMEGVRVNGNGSFVGSLAGLNGGSITASCSMGAIRGTSAVGGLVGSNSYGGIAASYSTGTVTGNNNVGGLAGFNWGSIATIYSTGRVTGNVLVGGLVGRNYGSIASSFWDMETSGQATSAGAIGKTTAEMQTASTFLDAGWDFVDETANGTEDIWWILEGQDYPRLWWELVGENSAVVPEN